MSYNSITDRSWFQRKRAIIDTIARTTIGMGGISVIFAIVLIFFYLLWVVAPIFKSPEVTPIGEFNAPVMLAEAETKYIAIEESGQLGLRIASSGEILFFNLETGVDTSRNSIDLAEYSSISHVVEMNSEGTMLALGLDNGRVKFIGIEYRVNFVDGKREIIPSIAFPFGEEALELNYISNIHRLQATFVDGERLVLAALDTSGQLLLQSYEVEKGDDIADVAEESVTEVGMDAEYLLLDPLADWVYLANSDGQIIYYNISDIESIEQIAQQVLVKPERRVSHLRLSLGGISLLATDDTGNTVQWSLQRDDKNQYQLAEVRNFQASAAIDYLLTERRRKGLVGISTEGNILLYHTTAERQLLEEKILDRKPVLAAVAPRADMLLVKTEDEKYRSFKIDNPHPELSWQALWGKIVYEGYTEPKYIWQSSSADDDFEPKFSLAPLAFGTLKAAFYAMMIAMPLAIMGAIYTAYFMAPRMRGWVKPSIEIMEALPTVILGFLAGLWFAPIVEDNLLAILSLLFVFPAGLLLFAWGWSLAPKYVRRLVPEGWQALLLMPVVIALVWMSFVVAPLFEAVLFGGDIKAWMLRELGIGYDQRNSLVVGIAMGLAVIPTIFSITEDAIFSVPRQLTTGSLALGATPWQTLMRVVLLTASPGIFSAVMIGLGRAVGETMIVLMATGNTPVMDMSIFEGMRTLSANIAVELPESEVDSSHYRILFLAALVLFIVTFFFNTAAEVVRQRLRKRYGSM
ncbi:MAG: ABC transporter permease subunit [Gammaproteobacteria bacterium]|nr:ABC transporter permease subunit [Gammaproteobacteria bacterium]